MPSAPPFQQRSSTHFFRALAAGIVISQALATLHLFWSNQQRFLEAEILHRAGYLVVPNLVALPTLKAPAPAFFGGLFFTLSIGAGLSLLTLSCCWAWHHLLGRNQRLIGVFVMLWSVPLVFVNLDGIHIFPSLYILVIPIGVVISYFLGLGGKPDPSRVLNRLLPVYPIVLLGVLWGTQASSRLFVNIRDYLLLSNPVGTAINDFYYHYTLYPADTFRSLEQKIQRTGRVEGIEDPRLKARLENLLLRFDYLTAPDLQRVDLRIVKNGNDLVFYRADDPILRSRTAEFFSRPNRYLRDFSRKTDRYTNFRALTFLCIIFAFPIFLYVCGFGLVCYLLGLFFEKKRAETITAIVCFGFGALLFLPVYSGSRINIDATGLKSALQSRNWRENVAALRFIAQENPGPEKFAGLEHLSSSRFIPVRYWAARALAHGRDPAAEETLLALSNDPEPIVACQALWALGRRGNKNVMEKIRLKVQTAQSWYVQRYGYIALRALGWRQPASK